MMQLYPKSGFLKIWDVLKGANESSPKFCVNSSLVQLVVL